MLKIIKELFESLNNNRIRYCHWKSNIYIDNMLEGKTDVDLLVNRKDINLFESVLISLNFKRAFLPNSESDLSVYHFYGFDEETGIIVHLHIYYRIITGGDILKNYRLPLENLIFKNTRYIGIVPVPQKSVELMIFVIRTMLKYGSFIENILIYGKDEEIKKEMQWLTEGDTELKSLELLKEYLPFMNSKYFSDCIRELKIGSSIIKRIILGKRMRFYLKDYIRYTTCKSFIIANYRFFRKVLRRGIIKRKIPVSFSSGVVIAVIGPEASGKSTVVSEISKWLGEHFSVLSIHSGKPPSTLLTFIPNLLLPLLRYLFPKYRTSVVEDKDLTSQEEYKKRKKSLLYIIRQLMIGYDRKKLLIKAYRMATNGVIVISDRYPTLQIGAVDSAQLDCSSFNNSGILYRLAKAENNIYKTIPSPDIVIQLNIPVDIAVQRNITREKKGIESEDYIRRRHSQSANIVFPEEITLKINTDQPIEEMILSLKKHLWKYL